jgi:hypothetical protein
MGTEIAVIPAPESVPLIVKFMKPTGAVLTETASKYGVMRGRLARRARAVFFMA